MKKLLVFVICFMFTPVFINALEKNEFNIITEDEITIEDTINGSSVTLGNTINSKGDVKGIDINFGMQINYSGNSDYALLAGLNVNVDGIVNNDGLILGDIISFNENFIGKRDLFVFGTTVNLKGKIERNITIYATNVVIDAEITGNIKIMATDIEIAENTNVSGKLSYNEDSNIEISPFAKVAQKELLKSMEYTPTFVEKASSYIMSLLGSLVLFAFLNIVVPSLFKKVEENNKDKKAVDYFSMLGYGALAFILVPILSIMLLSISVTQPVAFLIIALYIIAMLLSNVFVGYLLGYIIWTKLIKKEENKYLIALIGIVLLSILSILPIVGTLILMIALMLNMGIIIQLFKKII